MPYYYLEPEVAGSWGGNTEVDTSVHPPAVSKLHYEFEGWLGDDLLTSFPSYIVSEKLKDKLSTASITGYKFDSVEITKSEQFDQVSSEQTLPNFYWLRVTGEAGIDDFGITDDYRLVVSEAVLHILQTCNVEHCEIEIYP